jgi:predicted peptidase
MLALCLVSLTGCRGSAPLEPLFKLARVSDGTLALPYALYLPREYTSRRQWPVLLFLHGYGERGEDGAAQTRVGLGPVVQRTPERFPCIVVMPQAPRSYQRWTGRANSLALRALEEVIREYNGDRRRIYLSGVSMGASGGWRILSADPGRFAAALLVCGRTEPTRMAPRLTRVPIRVYHGARDRIVPASYSRAMVAAIRSAGGRKVEYLEYPDAGHADAWEHAYSDPASIAWLLAQRKP